MGWRQVIRIEGMTTKNKARRERLRPGSAVLIERERRSAINGQHDAGDSYNGSDEQEDNGSHERNAGEVKVAGGLRSDGRLFRRVRLTHFVF